MGARDRWDDDGTRVWDSRVRTEVGSKTDHGSLRTTRGEASDGEVVRRRSVWVSWASGDPAQGLYRKGVL